MYLVKGLYHYSTYSVLKHIKMDKMKINFYHLVFLLKGQMTYIADGIRYEMNENDAILLRPGMIREREQGEQPSKYVIFNFHPFDSSIFSENDIIFKNAVTPNIRKLLTIYPYSFTSYTVHSDSLLNHETKKNANIMYNILNCILIELLDNKRCKTQNPHVLNAIKYINDNITLPLSLNNVCEAIHISKEYTAKIFKEEMGKTVTEYINEQKMLIARDMLVSNEVSMRDTALNLGYENYSYFSRVFKKYFNTSPAKVKNSSKM